MNECSVIVKTNGSMEIIDERHLGRSSKLSLKEQQDIVGGLIEHVYPRIGRSLPLTRIIANEEGRLLNLPFNFVASFWFGACLQGDVIVVFKNYQQLSSALISVINKSLTD